MRAKPFCKKYGKNGQWRWYVRIRDAQHPKGKDVPLSQPCDKNDTVAHQEALAAYNAILANRAPVTDDSKVSDLFAKYLEWCEKHRPRSYSWYQRFLRTFVEHNPNLTLAVIKTHHIQ